jgi:catechol 2,3-dioxygenase
MGDYGIRPPGYRLPDAAHPGQVRLQVSHLARSIEYYEDVLGLTVVSSDAESAALAAAGEDRPLIRLHERKGARPVPRRGALGLYHYAILLPDRIALGQFLAHLARLDIRAGSADHAVSEAVYLSDPDGLGIEVYADRPRSVWRVDRNQLHMTTEPLDVRSLVAIAGERPWSGLPAGTVMGHVHLHVGDLDEAGAFYHRALGFDKTVWNYPGALFMSAGGYHHHLGTNTWSPGAPAADGEARLLSWDLVLPTREDVADAGLSLIDGGYTVEDDEAGASVRDPWGTRLRIVTG